MKGFEQEILAAGCTGYVTKPIDIDILLGTLAEKLGVGKRVKAAPAPAAERAAPAPAPLTASIPMPVLEERIDLGPAAGAGGPPVVSRFANHPRLRSAAARFAGRLGEQLDAMDRAHAGGNFVELTALAHWLKGAGGTVGYDDFTAPARDLETLSKAGDAQGSKATLAELRGLEARLVVPDDAGVQAARSAASCTGAAEQIPHECAALTRSGTVSALDWSGYGDDPDI